MYGHFRDALSTDHECVLTDVSRDNPRSLRAHLRTGFEVLGSLSHAGEAWDVVIWDWRREARR
jgi:RimJ/RimL family protein N-acetyltransferase